MTIEFRILHPDVREARINEGMPSLDGLWSLTMQESQWGNRNYLVVAENGAIILSTSYKRVAERVIADHDAQEARKFMQPGR